MNRSEAAPAAPLQAFLALPGVVDWAQVAARRGSVVSLGTLPEPQQAWLCAALMTQTERPVVVCCDRFKSVERLAADASVWLGEARVEVYPEDDALDEESLGGLEVRGCRLGVLRRLREPGAPRLLLTTTVAWQQRVPPAAALGESTVALTRGAFCEPDALVGRLTEAGFLPVSRVDGRGQVARRGGIVDVFPFEAEWPVRLEFFGDEVESLREFSPEDQLRRRDLTNVVLWLGTGGGAAEDTSSLADYLDARWIRVDASRDAPLDEAAPLLIAHEFLKRAPTDTVLLEARRALLLRSLADWLREGWTVVLACNNEGERSRLEELLAEEDPALPSQLTFVLAPLRNGFAVPSAKWVMLTDAEIFNRYQTVLPARHEADWQAGRGRTDALEVRDWREGDYVVHLHHGVGLFLGIHAVNMGGEADEDALTLEFAGGSRLYVPLDQAHLVSRYAGIGGKRPELDAMGGGRWERKRLQAGKAVMDYAAQLLRLEAERQVKGGHAFPPDTDWQREFEESFLHEETVDQLTGILATKQDMEAARPMDRLICGDVGFGKTEVAIRAAFKAVTSGKQVAFLCPTTVLAQQHYETLRQRMADYPVRVEVLSRFVSVKQQKRVLAGVASGEVDIVVGTHRLISADVKFKDVGLLIVDEEQRFGVKHKDRLKERFRQIDILTLSATPIPRTLYLALTGARDMSTLETPPRGRIPVETHVLAYDERVIRAAVERELARDGQVFYLHNRIGNIEEVAKRIRDLVPGARVMVGHGQMAEDDLEQVMMEFIAGRADVLVSTTIIESGIDIPNANTIIIDRADLFGLADLYQLRGRVGRGAHRAYAYLMMPRHLFLSSAARKRTGAIQQYAQLGAGFKIAMRDLEMRGAGNLLGTQQSGHVVAIGFDLYCQLLRQAVDSLRSGRPVVRRDISVRVPFLATQAGEMAPDKLALFLPGSFIADARERVSAYRELSQCDTPEECDALRGRWQDRFGRLPDTIERLIRLNRLKRFAALAMAQSIEVVDDQVRVKRGGDYILVGTRFPRLLAESPAARFDELEKIVTQLLT